MLHESSATRLFTPVSLGEMLKARAANTGVEKDGGHCRTYHHGGQVRAQISMGYHRRPWGHQMVILMGRLWDGCGCWCVTVPFIRLIRQRPQELDVVKSMGVVHAYAVWYGFDATVTDVTGKTNWMREYLEDFKFQASPKFTRRSKNFYWSCTTSILLTTPCPSLHTLPFALAAFTTFPPQPLYAHQQRLTARSQEAGWQEVPKWQAGQKAHHWRIRSFPGGEMFNTGHGRTRVHSQMGPVRQNRSWCWQLLV